MIDLTPMVQAAVILASTVITGFVVPYIQSRTTTEKQKQLTEWAKIGVAAAEQLYQDVDGPKKKEYVLQFLQDKGFKVDLDTLSFLIESEVNEQKGE